MLAPIAAALLSTLSFTDEVTAEGGDYVVIPFQVPAGTFEIGYAHSDGADDDVLDFGLWDQTGLRGWGGGLEDAAFIGVAEASRGYLPGPITEGEWYVVIGKAKIASPPATYDVTLSFYDAESRAPRPRADYAARTVVNSPGWYAGDLHVHSRESGDAEATFDQNRGLALGRGLDFVVLSDHNTVSQHALMAAYQETDGDLLFVRGSEITTYAGHGNGLGIAAYVDHRIGLEGRTIDGVLDDVRAQDGLFIVNHPRLDLGDVCIGCAWDHETDWSKVAAMELLTGPASLFPVTGRPVLEMWDGLLDQGYRITGVGGSDDHRAGMGEGATSSPIGSPTTMVYASTLSEAGLLGGVAAGRVVVKLRGQDDPMVELTAVGDDGEVRALGETATGAEVEVTARVTDGAGRGLVFVIDGEPGELIALDDGDATVVRRVAVAEAGSRIRAHVVDGAADVTITNHVFLAYAEPRGGGGTGCGCRSGGARGGGWLVALVALAAALGLRRRRQPFRPASSSR